MWVKKNREMKYSIQKPMLNKATIREKMLEGSIAIILLAA